MLVFSQRRPALTRGRVILCLMVLVCGAFCQNLHREGNEVTNRQNNQFSSESDDVLFKGQQPPPTNLVYTDSPENGNGNSGKEIEVGVEETEEIQPETGKEAEGRRVFPRVKVLPPSLSSNYQTPFQIPPKIELQKVTRVIDAPLEYNSYMGNGIQTDQRLQARAWLNLVDEDLLQVSDTAKQEHDYYSAKYQIDSYQELPFCIVVPTYNNMEQDRYLRNIRSIVMQNYMNYHIVVIDDASTDGTGVFIDAFLKQQKVIPQEKYRIVTNSQSMKAMYNLRRAANEYCRPQEIFLVVDGDDELLGRQVLKLFNSQFQKNGAWFVYSNFIMDNQAKVGYSRPFTASAKEKNNYRRYPFVTSHLRAFYTQMFRNIKEEDLRDEKGQYYRAANDVAICLPILEQSHTRVHYIPQLTYYYNANTGQNNHLVRSMQQRGNEKKVRRKQPYQPLGELVFNMN